MPRTEAAAATPSGPLCSPVWFLAASGGYVFLFGIWGGKISLFAPIYLMLFFILSGLPKQRIHAMFVLGLLTLLCMPLVFGDGGLWGTIGEWWVAIVHVRTFSVPPLLISQYMDFFLHHPLTLGSHITGLNLFIDYPYDLDVPRTVGYHFYSTLVTSNANFWAQDGIAGGGVIGAILISFGVALVLWVLDSITASLPFRFVATALGAVLGALANASIFTTLLTGGLGWLMLIFWLLPGSSRPTPGAAPSR